MAYLDNNGVLYLWGKIKSHVSAAINAIVIPSKTSELTNDSGFITSDDVPEGAAASTTTPKMDGDAAVGSETAFARGDHVHPSDTSKVDTISGYGLATIAKNEGIYQISVREGSNVAKNAFVVSAETFNASAQAVQAALGNYDSAITDIRNNYAKKTDIASMYKYSGSVATYSALPSSGNTTGDVYNVEASGMNYAWNGTEWDALGESFQITAITNAELDAICT